MGIRRRLRRAALAAAVLAAGIGVGAASASGEGGLPDYPADDPPLGPLAVHTVGRSEAKPSKQWFRIPETKSDVYIWQRGEQHDRLCAEVYVVSPGGGHGELPRFSVRTLAFGMVPAEISLELRQVRRDAGSAGHPFCSSSEGALEPWLLTGPGPVTVGGQDLRGRVDVRITAMTLDGATVRIGGSCRTEFPAWLELASDDGYTPLQGGELSGTIDVPPFRGCGGGGEDLDGLVTSAVSGPDNPLEIRQSPAGGSPAPPDYPLPD